MSRPLGSNTTPTYRKHKASGQAIVTINGTDRYLGPHGTKASKREYDRLVGEWMAGGRRLAVKSDDFTVAELIAAFYAHAKTYYRLPDSTPSSEIDNIRQAMRPLKQLYGHTRCADFGPLALKALIARMSKLGWCRTNINRNLGRIKLAFKWAVANQLIEASIHHGLKAVDGLRLGRSDARESSPVKPVADERVDAILPYCSTQVKAIIELQRLTGMRAGEVVIMRACDLDTTGEVWMYRPAQHKTLHHGHKREIPLGPHCRQVIEPFLNPDLSRFLFSPADSERTRRGKLSQQRTTPMSCGNTPGSKRKRKTKRSIGDRYTVDSYRRTITRACDKAFQMPAELHPKPTDTPEQAKARNAQRHAWRTEHTWHPHQLRHSAATRLRKQFGLEAAQVILGHKHLGMTELYAEQNVSAARAIMAQVG